ncbi:hypothetical protein P3L10_019575 [Capsicum annuum]
MRGTFKSIDKLEKITNEVKLEQSPGATSPVMQTTSNPPASISTMVAASAEQLVDAHVMKEKEVQGRSDRDEESVVRNCSSVARAAWISSEHLPKSSKRSPLSVLRQAILVE